VSADDAIEWRTLSGADLEQRLNALLSAHGASLTRLAGSYVVNAGDREDLLQDILVAIWRAMPHFRGECSERTFLFRIAHNRAVTYITRRKLPISDSTGEVDVEDGRPNPEQALTTAQQGRRLFDAVQRLPVNQRQVVTLVLEGLSYAEIADVLGITETNVGARLTRARQMLRTLL
jgi:RNA polymerase sigma factor (sigma-70 family)